MYRNSSFHDQYQQYSDLNPPYDNYQEQAHQTYMPGNYLNCRFCRACFYYQNDLNNHMNYCPDALKYQSEYYGVRNNSLYSGPVNNAPYQYNNYNADFTADKKLKKEKPKKNEKYRSDKDNFNFLPVSGRLQEDIIACLYCAGILQSDSLTGGCGWWLVSKDVVIAYGAVPVHQTFPSMIGLEYEGLLFGMQAATRKGVQRLVIKGSQNLCFIHENMRGVRDYFQTVQHSLKSVTESILKALQAFREYQFTGVTQEEIFYPLRLAKKAVTDYQKRQYLSILKVQSEASKQEDKTKPGLRPAMARVNSSGNISGSNNNSNAEVATFGSPLRASGGRSTSVAAPISTDMRDFVQQPFVEEPAAPRVASRAMLGGIDFSGFSSSSMTVSVGDTSGYYESERSPPRGFVSAVQYSSPPTYPMGESARSQYSSSVATTSAATNSWLSDKFGERSNDNIFLSSATSSRSSVVGGELGSGRASGVGEAPSGRAVYWSGESVFNQATW